MEKKLKTTPTEIKNYNVYVETKYFNSINFNILNTIKFFKMI